MANLRAAYAEAQVASLESADYKGDSTSVVKITSNGKFDKVTDPKIGDHAMAANEVTTGKSYKVHVETSSTNNATTVTFVEQS